MKVSSACWVAVRAFEEELVGFSAGEIAMSQRNVMESVVGPTTHPAAVRAVEAASSAWSSRWARQMLTQRRGESSIYAVASLAWRVLASLALHKFFDTPFLD